MFYSKVKKIILFCVTVIFVFALCACEPFDIEVNVNMFADITECEKIKANGNNVKICTANNDEYLKNLEYENFFGCEYTADEFALELFAYEFSSADTAQDYFENATGKSNDSNPAFLDVSGISKFVRVAVSGNRAYAVYCSKSSQAQTINFLNSCFSEEMFGEKRTVSTSPTSSSNDGTASIKSSVGSDLQNTFFEDFINNNPIDEQCADDLLNNSYEMNTVYLNYLNGWKQEFVLTKEQIYLFFNKQEADELISILESWESTSLDSHKWVTKYVFKNSRQTFGTQCFDEQYKILGDEYRNKTIWLKYTLFIQETGLDPNKYGDSETAVWLSNIRAGDSLS